MGSVTFLSPSMDRPVRVELPRHEDPTILAVATAYGLPLDCRCARARCGECAIRVAILKTSSQPARLSFRERGVLFRAGKLNADEFLAESPPDHHPQWRLACQARVGEDDILVAF